MKNATSVTVVSTGALPRHLFEVESYAQECPCGFVRGRSAMVVSTATATREQGATLPIPVDEPDKGLPLLFYFACRERIEVGLIVEIVHSLRALQKVYDCIRRGSHDRLVDHLK